MSKEDYEIKAIENAEIYSDKHGLNFEERCAYKLGFEDGANWRINSLWHYDKSSPMLNKPFLFVCRKGAIVLQLRSEKDWGLFVKDLIFVKWAYIEDLIPTNE